MKKIVTENILCKIFCFISTLVFIMLFYYSMMETWVNSYDLKEEYVYVQQDMLIFNIVALMAVILVAGLLYMHGQPRIGRINMDIAAVTVCICSFIFSVYWVVASDTMPQADQEIACLFAEAFENGDSYSASLVGFFYEKGYGVFQNYFLAVQHSMQNFSFPTRNQTHASCTESTEP